MKKELMLEKEKPLEVTSNNVKTEDSDQSSTKSLIKQINNVFININESNLNLLDNFEFIQYRNIKMPRIAFTNNYNFSFYKKYFDDFLNIININNSSTIDSFYKFPKIPCKDSTKSNNENLNNNQLYNDILIDISNDNSLLDNNFNLNPFGNIINTLNIISTAPNEETKEIKIEKNNNNKNKFKKIFSLKTYDKNKNLIYKKRGRRSTKEITHVHSALDDDNILRKIQVHFLSFLVSFTNDYLKAILEKQGKKEILQFKNFDYKLKKTINHESIEKMKSLKIGNILQMAASPKNKTCDKNINKIIYDKLCEMYPELNQIYFNKLFKEFFIEYYYNKQTEGKITINGFSFNLSNKTHGFNMLIQKNIENKDKFRKIASYFYICKIRKKEGKVRNSYEEEDNLKQKPYFIID
jgi:hypothetical protein